MSPVRSAEDDRYPYVVRIRTHEARNDRARNGSRPDHPLHSAYIARNEAALAWFLEKQTASAAVA